MKDMLNKINAYKILIKDTERTNYLNRIRLRSIASQYLSVTPMLNDGNFFPFFMFTVFDAKSGEQRLLELNFVEDVLHDRFKDHCCRSYHFSMLKRVNKVVDQTNCIFNIEFNTEKHTYRTVVST